MENYAFDLWAENYDADVALSDASGTYPFAGYREVLNMIYRKVHERPARSVLDIGFGTGTLTARLYRDGYAVTGIDFSARMLEHAREKMPDAALYQYDFSCGLPDTLAGVTFDVIISTYAVHHLSDDEKYRLFSLLIKHLAPGGEILIGDVAFYDREALSVCRAQAGDEWDDEESYIVFEELQRAFPAATFVQISACAGVVRLAGRR